MLKNLINRRLNLIPNFATTKFRLNWMRKRVDKYMNTINTAFLTVRAEIIAFLNNYKGEVNNFIKCLANSTSTSDVNTFLQELRELIKIAQGCKGDPEAQFGILVCRYAIFRFHILSKFTLFWTNVKIGCDKCGKLNKTNFLYSNRLCPWCGNIIL